MVWIVFVHGELNVLYRSIVALRMFLKLTSEYLMFYIFLNFFHAPRGVLIFTTACVHVLEWMVKMIIILCTHICTAHLLFLLSLE